MGLYHNYGMQALFILKYKLTIIMIRYMNGGIKCSKLVGFQN